MSRAPGGWIARAARIARRELRGGLGGFYIFLACLALGVAAIAAVGSVRVSITEGLVREGRVILGGDAEIEFAFRFATPGERAWLEEQGTVSEVIDFRSMAATGQGAEADRALTQVKAVDALYPLTGTVELDPAIPLAEALAGDGVVVHPVLADRLGLAVGDRLWLGTAPFTIRALLQREPDAGAAGFGLGPRTLVRTAALEGTGLLAEGSLFDTDYRLAMPGVTDEGLDAVRAEAETVLADTGARWRDRRNASPAIQRFVDRIGAFLVLVGLAGLAVGGVGVSSAVRAYLTRKTPVIATLKTLGAEGRVIFAAYLMQVAALSVLGIGIGMVLGTLIPMIAGPLIEARLPVPVALGVHPGPLLEAALYGALTALIFTLWPLARTERVRAAALFRDAVGADRGWPRARYLAALAVAVAALVGLAAGLSGIPTLALWSAAGIAAALGVLMLAAWGVRALARRLARSTVMRGRPALRLALGAVGGPGFEATAVVLSLGLGLTVLAAVGQIDANMRAAISRDLPERATSSPTRSARSSTGWRATPPSPAWTPRRCWAAWSRASPAGRPPITTTGSPAATAGSASPTPSPGAPASSQANGGPKATTARLRSASPARRRRSLAWVWATRSPSTCWAAPSRRRSHRSARSISAPAGSASCWSSTPPPCGARRIPGSRRSTRRRTPRPASCAMSPATRPTSRRSGSATPSGW